MSCSLPSSHITVHLVIIASVTLWGPSVCCLDGTAVILRAMGCLDCCVEKDSETEYDVLFSDVIMCKKGGNGSFWTGICQPWSAACSAHTCCSVGLPPKGLLSTASWAPPRAADPGGLGWGPTIFTSTYCAPSVCRVLGWGLEKHSHRKCCSLC